MTAGTKRRVRVVIEAEAHEISGKCGLLRLDMEPDETGLTPVVMVNPRWAGVSVEDLAPSYNWRDGDVVLSEGSVWVREGGRWNAAKNPFWSSDGDVSKYARGGAEILRYQAGGM